VDSSTGPRRLELHVILPYKAQPSEHPGIRRYLDQGYRIEVLQRLTDREAIVVLARTDAR